MSSCLKFMTLENLTQYHKKLMEMLSDVQLVQINQCPNCGGIITKIDECEYCGAQLKLVVKKGAKNIYG